MIFLCYILLVFLALSILAVRFAYFHPLTDLVSDYRICTEIQFALIEQHENKMTGVSQLYFKRSTANYCVNNLLLFNILGILYKHNFFSSPWEKDDNSFQIFSNEISQIKDERMRIGGSAYEDGHCPTDLKLFHI